MKKYGKSNMSIISQKKTFFKDNDSLVLRQKEMSKIYQLQPKRKKCKNCRTDLLDEIDFIKNQIPYKICLNCNHLNGNFEDTDEFCEAIYIKNQGANYSLLYTSKDLDSYNFRVSTIYFPKAEFLYSSLVNEVNPNELKYLDFGAGSGYFVSALKKLGLNKLIGSEVSGFQVSFGNKMIGEELLQIHELKETRKVILDSDANVISMIGVLEHLQDPREVLSSIQENDSIQYCYLSVPLFSLSVYIEMLSEEIFHRQLYGGHTHLYSEQSLQHLIKEFDFEVVSEWWFGTDIMDLYRNIFVTMNQKKFSDKVKKEFDDMFLSSIDSLQLELDKKHFSSEVHLLLKKKNNNVTTKEIINE